MDEKRYLYSAAIHVRDLSRGVFIKAIALNAINKDEAIGMALRYAKETAWPGAQFTDHGAMVFQIPDHLVLNCEQTRGGK